MAPKCKILTDSPAISSSSQEEHGSSSEENIPQAQTPLSPPSKKPQSSTKTPPQQESSSEEEADSETEPEPEPEPEAVSQKHSVVAKPNPALSLPPKSTKRASESTHEGAKSSKRPKVADGSSKKPEDAKRGAFEPEDAKVADSSSKKPEDAKVAKKPEDAKRAPFERLWSEDDEIALLNGMIEFEEERGLEISKDVTGFFDFIKDSLHCKVKLQQVKDKMKKLKKKFVNNKLQSGVEAKFGKSHDQDCFNLSMKIWGIDGVSSSGGGLAESSGVKSMAAKKGSITDVGGVNKLDSSLGRHLLRSCMGAANMEEMVMSGLEMFQGEKKTELEDRWTKFHADQLELYLMCLDLLKEQSRLFLEELRSSLVGNF